jgi:Flp pilus assembly pilin Flp
MNKVLLNWRLVVSERLRSRYVDRGAGFVEYAGLLVLIALVVAAVMAIGIPGMVRDAIQQAVADITSG